MLFAFLPHACDYNGASIFKVVHSTFRSYAQAQGKVHF